jgi:hypothetical protein
LLGKLSATAVLFVTTCAASAAAAEDAEDAENATNTQAAESAANAAPPPATANDASGAGGADVNATFVARHYYPPPVDGPALRVPAAATRLYLDGGFAESRDLSALPYIAGQATNFRFALGGAWRWRRLTLEAEVPFGNVTTLDVTQVPGGVPTPEDMHQTTYSIGDARVGAVFAAPPVASWGDALLIGFGLRGRLATHSTRFVFHLPYSIAYYSFPYYFHVEPTLIVAAIVDRFTFIMNQGTLTLIGPDGQVGDQLIMVPTIHFWDAHYAVSYVPFRHLGASVELATTFQLNSIGGLDFAKFNDVRAAWLAPALQLHFGGYRIDLIARLGLSRGQELLGVLAYVGTNSFTLRVTKSFD